MAASKTCIETISQPLKLPCGLVLPNRLVKCPMQETLAVLPHYDPPVEKFRELYGKWGSSKYGLIITGQVQVDIRFLSIAGDVVVRKESLEPQTLKLWKEWASIAQADGTPCIVQLAHPGRMSPKGAGIRPDDMESICPSAVPVELGERWIDKKAVELALGTPREATLEDIDEAVQAFVIGAQVAQAAGFAGVQIHAAHGFLVSQFLSPHTNRRNDEYGGTPEKRLRFLQRIVRETRAACPGPFCVSVKLNSADYMKSGGLEQDEALEQVRWLIECGMVDMVEISGGNASAQATRLNGSLDKKSLEKAPTKKESTYIRECFFADFAEKVQALKGSVPIQLSGGYRSRIGMADAIECGSTDLIGLGRAAVIEPDLPAAILLNEKISDSEAIALPHQIQGLWLARMMPTRVVGSGLPIQYFYYNMRLLGAGLPSDPDISLPFVIMYNILGLIQQKAWSLWSTLYSYGSAKQLPDPITSTTSEKVGELMVGRSQVVQLA